MKNLFSEGDVILIMNITEILGQGFNLVDGKRISWTEYEIDLCLAERSLIVRFDQADKHLSNVQLYALIGLAKRSELNFVEHYLDNDL